MFDRTSYAQFIGLNPSTADETLDDPTVRRCISFARSLGFGALCMTNAFGWRSTDPAIMKAQSDPVGTENDYWLKEVAASAGIVIAAWGVHGSHMGRDREITRMISERHCLGTTKDGYPKHPLYVPAVARPTVYLIPEND